MRTLLSEAELGGHEGVVDDVEDVRVVVFEEEESFLCKPNIVKIKILSNVSAHG